MRYSVKLVDREFAPREAAAITKVSTALQRDWRRREILPQRESEGWSVFLLSDVILMSSIKMLSECGFALSDAKDIASLTSMPVYIFLSGFEGNYEFEGLELSQVQKDRLRMSHARGHGMRYLKVPLPANTVRLGNVKRSNDLADFSVVTDSTDATASFLVIDCHRIGEHIMQEVNGPLFRVEVEEIPEE